MPSHSSAAARRRARFAVLAHADTARLEALWQAHGLSTAYQRLRGPEAGLVMLTGRMGGDGAPFHCGEASVSRCSVRFEGGPEGHAMVLGRDGRKAELIALIDASAQWDAAREQLVDETIIGPLAAERQAHLAEKAQDAARTRVNFFTMVRGEDA